MPGVGIEVKGRRLLSLKIQRAVNRIGRFEELHRRIGVESLAWIGRNFRASGLERPWKPLRPSTLLARRVGRRAGTAKPLLNTGGLAGSFSFRATAAEVRTGSPMDLAKWHHGGTGPYEIRPRTKKALAFVSPFGAVKRPGVTRRLLGRERGREFTSFRMAGRSKKAFGQLPFLVVKSVKHPGLPARPLLPSDRAALDIALKVGRSWVREHLAELGGT